MEWNYGCEVIGGRNLSLQKYFVLHVLKYI